MFQAEQASTEVTIEQLQAGGATRRRGKFYRIKDHSIQIIKEKFNNGTYALEEYIEHLNKWMGFLQPRFLYLINYVIIAFINTTLFKPFYNAKRPPGPKAMPNTLNISIIRSCRTYLI